MRGLAQLCGTARTCFGRAAAALALAGVLSACTTPAAGQSVSGGGSSAAPASSAPAESAAPSSPTAMPLVSQAMLYPGEDFKLSPGDLISVHVFQEPDYVATVRVSQDGTVPLPFIGSVPVQGLSVGQAQALIADRLRTGGFYRDPEVILQVLDTVNGTVTITGEVKAIVPVSTERSLREVLLMAGGLPATASHTVKIVRQGVAEPITVDLGPDLAASSAANFPVRPHDIIQITRANVVYVLGAFAKQGAVPLDQAAPLTLLQMAALSGGINFEGQYNDLRLIRTIGNERKEIRVDIKAVREGKAPDPVLQANDIVFLPTNALKAASKGIGIGGILAMLSIIYTIQH